MGCFILLPAVLHSAPSPHCVPLDRCMASQRSNSTPLCSYRSLCTVSVSYSTRLITRRWVLQAAAHGSCSARQGRAVGCTCRLEPLLCRGPTRRCGPCLSPPIVSCDVVSVVCLSSLSSHSLSVFPLCLSSLSDCLPSLISLCLSSLSLRLPSLSVFPLSSLTVCLPSLFTHCLSSLSLPLLSAPLLSNSCPPAPVQLLSVPLLFNSLLSSSCPSPVQLQSAPLRCSSSLTPSSPAPAPLLSSPAPCLSPSVLVRYRGRQEVEGVLVEGVGKE